MAGGLVMKSRGLMALVMASMLGLFSTFAFAQKATPLSGGQANKDDVLSWQQAQKIKLARKPAGVSRPVSCSLYSRASYLQIGSFWDPYNSDRLVRNGLAIGNGCYYTHDWFRIGMGWEFYDGSFAIDHIEPGFNGSVYFDEIGVKQWIYSALVLGEAEMAFTAGVQKTATSDLKIKDLYIDPGFGWLNLGLFAADALHSSVDLKIWEVGVDAVFPLNLNTSLTFGMLWQRYEGTIHIDYSMYGKTILQYFDFYDLDSVKDILISADSVHLTPGLKWCQGRKFCASVAIPWGVFASDVWALGGEFKLEWKY